MLVRIVNCLIESEVTHKGLYIEYFDKLGYFYSQKEEQPNGIGVPFDTDLTKNWLNSGKVVLVGEIEASTTVWGKSQISIYKDILISIEDQISILQQKRDDIVAILQQLYVR